tara:strand:- start:408 stop:590 length:183 start_codon:yes stop_codon:yes gene_type:complete
MACQRSIPNQLETSENQAERGKHYAQQCIKKIGQKVLNRKVSVCLPNHQIFKFGVIKKKR